MRIYHSFLIHSSADGHLGCFHVLAIINSAVMNIDISNFLEEISSLSHSVFFLYFFALIAEEGFLISSCYSLKLCFQMLISFLFIAVCKSSSDNHFAFLHFFFLGMVLITPSCTMSQNSVHSFSGTQSIRSNPLNLFVTSTV